MDTEKTELDRRRQDTNEKIADVKEQILEVREAVTALTVRFAIIEYKTNLIMLLLAFLGTTIGALVISDIATRLKPKNVGSVSVIQLIYNV